MAASFRDRALSTFLSMGAVGVAVSHAIWSSIFTLTAR